MDNLNLSKFTDCYICCLQPYLTLLDLEDIIRWLFLRLLVNEFVVTFSLFIYSPNWPNFILVAVAGLVFSEPISSEKIRNIPIFSSMLSYVVK